MAKLLQLHGQSAASLYRHFDVKLGSDIEHCGIKEAVRLDGGILPWGSGMVEIAVFEKKECFYQQGRNVVHLGEQKLRLSMAKKRYAVGASDISTGFRRFHVRRRDSSLDELHHL